MDIATLKAKNRHTLTWMGEPVTIRRLTTADFIATRRMIEGMGEHATLEDSIEHANWLAFVASKCIIADDGSLPFDSDEGRQALRDCSLSDLSDIGQACASFSGLGEDQKKS